MRRPVMYLAGVLMATGAGLALAGPASAAPSHCHKGHHAGWWGPGVYPDYYGGDSRLGYSSTVRQNNGSNYYGFNFLTGNSSVRQGTILGII
jgi:hypothetical protein